MTNKFKFGDKVWHEEHGDGIYFKPGEKCSDYVIFKDDGYATKVESYDLIIVDDWVKCSERMPEFGQSVTVYDGDRMWTDTTYDFGDGLCFYYDDDGRATHWMPLPAPPVEVEQ